MASSTEMCNMATSHLAISTNIGSLDTSLGPNAEACRRFFDVAMETFQRDFPYAMVTKRETLGLVKENPSEEYQYEYTYPSTCQYIVQIVTNQSTDHRQSEIPFKIMRGESGRVIWTNEKDAELEFQFIENDFSRFPLDFALGFSFLLAGLIAPRVTGGDPFGLGAKAEAKFEKFESKARANSLNEQQEDLPPDSEFIRSQFGDTLNDRAQDWTAFPDNKDIF